MSYVDSQLLPGESVVYRARLHKIIFTLPVVTGALVVILSIASFWFPTELWIALVFGAIAIVSFLWAYVLYSTSEFGVTNKRVIMKVGWIRRRTLETMLSKVEGVGVDQELVGRMLDYGTIEVTGTGGTKEAFRRIAHPLEFRRRVQSAISPADDREERDCPFCAERILVRANVCKHCGREVPAATA